ncbi:TPA: hypothetical protein GRI80_00080 [Vibrio parahaemolyticus]|nr:BsuBI/PstI family type II restriction endonuclease [Vibrio parahaemolyticus]HAS6746398.1 hypothetical protein [Vibrio parahaemolyticus]
MVRPKRWLELEEALKDCSVGRVYVTAFPHRAEFRKNAIFGFEVKQLGD